MSYMVVRVEFESTSSDSLTMHFSISLVISSSLLPRTNLASFS